MSNNSKNLPFNETGKIGNDSWLESTYGSGNFVKLFGRSYRDFFDKRFVLIWMVSFLVQFSTALYFAINPPQTGYQREAIDRIQKQFATFVLEKEIEPKTEEPALFPATEAVSETGSTAGGAQRRDGAVLKGGFQSEQGGETDVPFSNEPGSSGDYLGSEKRRASREQISREVSSKGLLGLLTGSGSNAKGEAVSDVLGEAGAVQGDLEKALEDLDGLKKSGKPGAGGIITQGKGKTTQKGTRSTETSGIDELIAGKGQVQSTDIQRKGAIVVEQVSAIADERGIKSESRDPDQVSEVINRHNSSIQYCYQRELKQNPDLKGKLVVRFTVTPEGKVGDVKVISSTLNSTNIERCVLSRIKRWDDFGAIDPAKGDATFRQVYTFGY